MLGEKKHKDAYRKQLLYSEDLANQIYHERPHIPLFFQEYLHWLTSQCALILKIHD